MNEKTAVFLEKLKEYHSEKHDVSDFTNAVSYGDCGFLFHGEPLKTTWTAYQQLCRFVRIPPVFFRDVMVPSERIMLFERLNTATKKKRIYRFSGDTLYGVVSDNYRVIDNIELEQVVDQCESEGLHLVPERCNLNPDFTKVRFLPEAQEFVQVGELTPMIEFLNSENGMGSFRFLAGVYRKVCSNGLLVPVAKKFKAAWAHNATEEIRVPAFREILNVSRQYMHRLEQSRAITVSDIEKTGIVEDIKRKFGKKASENVLTMSNSRYYSGDSLFELINAITHAAQKYPPAIQTGLETFASKLLAA